MKTRLLKAALFSFFLSNVVILKAVPIITISYYKNCFIGCASTLDQRQYATYNLNGEDHLYVARVVICKGIGFNFCPSSVAAPINQCKERWIEEQSQNLYNYAKNQIEKYQNNKGEHRVYVHNVETNTTHLFTVTWKHTESEEAIEVTMDTDVVKLH